MFVKGEVLRFTWAKIKSMYLLNVTVSNLILISIKISKNLRKKYILIQ